MLFNTNNLIIIAIKLKIVQTSLDFPRVPAVGDVISLSVIGLSTTLTSSVFIRELADSSALGATLVKVNV